MGVEGWTDTDNDMQSWESGLGFTGEGHDQAREMIRGLGRPEPSLKVIAIVGPFPGFGFGR